MASIIAWPQLQRSLVAILRGIKPAEAESIVGTLVEEGFELIEIPLNSPDPYTSIRKAVDAFGSTCVIGAGTVLSAEQVDRLADAGGRLVVSPNIEPSVIARASEHKMLTMPGVFTPTEALLAIKCGASALKFFPGSVLGTSGVAAIKTILPAETIVGVVGGVSEASFADFRKIGVSTFGTGSNLYAPGDDAATVRGKARRLIAAYDQAAEIN
ncbi:2-dehydro-3-deoxy-6-phosphogalactonate aldolase [Aminobacter aganoensis]|uniref:2-dehydro-3-deoxyphosphogalactonate aldolase n=1 Tax=Aminobacter aganoensis TaxID=83264 RepID=A0A7X0KJJ1_9HYPH|nr:2-dehydro-3-deoxy-6-phosphogalactonate aldolase [Aminobacter aganoensis]MBB6353206.1 2-dehydro-3-deoxyphosphogalactonate aldolase [Aminobacter aganoensis]